jgi:hypothetical protein
MAWWLKPAIFVTQEAEIGRIQWFKVNPGKKLMSPISINGWKQ